MTPRPPMLKDMTVIVPTVGRRVLRACLDSIASGSAWPTELVLVDQSDNELVRDCAEVLRARSMSVTHLRSPGRGPGAARNRGVERVTTRWISFNEDDQVAPDWLTLMRDGVCTWPGGVVTGRVDAAATSAVHRRPLPDRDPLFSGNMGLSMSVCQIPFDEDAALIGAEDNDWGHRALRAGVPIVYLPGVAVTHLDWRTATELEDTHRRYARAQGAFYGKHVRHGDLHLARRAARDAVRGPWLVLRARFTSNQHLAMLGRAETAGIIPCLVSSVRRRPR